MKYVTRIRDIGFIVYKTCYYVILFSNINTYFKKSPYRLNQDIRNRVFEEVR